MGDSWLGIIMCERDLEILLEYKLDASQQKQMQY